MTENRHVTPILKGRQKAPKVRHYMAMTPKQLRAAIKRLDLTQVAAARALGVAPRTMRQWIAGDARIAEPAARLLAVWLAHPELLPGPTQTQAARRTGRR